MKTKSIIILKSKLAVYLACYEKAEKQNDHVRMSKLSPCIDDLIEEIDTAK